MDVAWKYEQHLKCEVEYRYINRSLTIGVYRSYFCHTHGHWTYELPQRVVATFRDGTQEVVHRREGENALPKLVPQRYEEKEESLDVSLSR